MPQTPTELMAILNAIQDQTAMLTEAAAQLEVTRHFTLDGRLVGDIGEMLAAQHLELTLDDAQRMGHDGFTTIEDQRREVQVKCRKASTLISFTSVPDLLVVIAFTDDWGEWDIVYNGVGTPIRMKAEADGFTIDGENRIFRNERRASLDVNLRWFRNLPANDELPASVPLRPEPLPIFRAR